RRGLSSEEAAIACGVSAPVGVRWFRERGGMPSIQLTPPAGRYLSFAEREDIALLRGRGLGVRAIARALGRPPSTISRELRRQRGHAWRPAQLSGVDRAVEGGAAGLPPQDGEAGVEGSASSVRPGPARRHDRPDRR